VHIPHPSRALLLVSHIENLMHDVYTLLLSYTCLYTKCVHITIIIYMYVYTLLLSYTCMYVCYAVCIHMHACVCVYVFVCMYIYMHIHT
jgi:hypothetical protein